MLVWIAHIGPYHSLISLSIDYKPYRQYFRTFWSRGGCFIGFLRPITDMLLIKKWMRRFAIQLSSEHDYLVQRTVSNESKCLMWISIIMFKWWMSRLKVLSVVIAPCFLIPFSRFSLRVFIEQGACTTLPQKATYTKYNAYVSNKWKYS